MACGAHQRVAIAEGYLAAILQLKGQELRLKNEKYKLVTPRF
jgi:hypothetical protein